MCGRFALFAAADELTERFHLADTVVNRVALGCRRASVCGFQIRDSGSARSTRTSLSGKVRLGGPVREQRCSPEWRRES